MIKFAYLCDQSEEKKKECKQYWHLCDPCTHTTDRKHALDGLWLEKFECLEGQDVTLIEKEEN